MQGQHLVVSDAASCAAEHCCGVTVLDGASSDGDGLF